MFSEGEQQQYDDRLEIKQQDSKHSFRHDLQAGNIPTSCCSNCRPGLSGQTAFSAVNLLAIASSSDSFSSSRSCDTYTELD